MAQVTKSATANMDASTGMLAPQISGLIAGENIPLLAACYIKGSDGKVYKTDATAADEKAKLAGFCPRAANSGEPVTLFGLGARFKYADATLTPGVRYFLSAATPGGLADAATTGDAVGVVQAITDSDVRVVTAI